MLEASPELAINVIKELIASGTDYLECKERERTKRERIAAELEAKLTLINRQYDVYSKIMEDHHEYAMRSYQMAEKLLNHPRVMENPHLMKEAMLFFANVHSKNSDSLSLMFTSMR